MNASELRSVFHDVISSQYRFPMSAHIALATAIGAFRTADPAYADMFETVFTDDCAYADPQHYELVSYIGPRVDCFVKTVYNRYSETFAQQTQDKIELFSQMIGMHMHTYTYYHFIAAMAAFVLEEYFGRSSIFSNAFPKPETKDLIRKAYEDLIDLFDARMRRIVFYNLMEQTDADTWSIRSHDDVVSFSKKWNLKITKLVDAPETRVAIFADGFIYAIDGVQVGTYSLSNATAQDRVFVASLSPDNELTFLASAKRWEESSSSDDKTNINIETFQDAELVPVGGELYIYDSEYYFSVFTMFIE